MEKKIKLISMAIVTIALVGMSAFYVACEKSSPSVEDQTFTRKGESAGSESIEIAYFDKEANEINLTFSRDEFEKMFSPVVDSLLGKDYVYEYISVVDDDVWGDKDFPALQISFFNIEEGSSYNLFCFDIIKSKEGGAIKYYMKGKPDNSGAQSWSFITCKGTDCSEGCKKIGKDCSACPPSNDPKIVPRCEKTEKDAWEVILGPAVSILVALIGLYGKLHSA